MITFLFIANTTVKKLMYAFGWMLIHSCWEGILLATLSFLVLRVYKDAAATKRYNFLLFVNILFVVCAGITFWFSYLSSAHDSDLHPAYFPIGSQENNITIKTSGSSLVQAATAYISAHTAWIVLIWLILFMFNAGKVLISAIYTTKIKAGSYHPADKYWAEKMQLLSRQLRLNKTVGLMESAKLKMPVVIGYFRPVIIIPIGMLTGLPPAQIDAVLLHELSHVRRNDNIINLLQILTESVFFFNPGVRWLNALIRSEREYCCDDMALQQTDDKINFIRALISFATSMYPVPEHASGFAGVKNQVLKRAERIASWHETKTTQAKSLFLLAFIIFFVCMYVALHAGRMAPALIAQAPSSKQTKKESTNNKVLISESGKKLVKTLKRLPSINTAPDHFVYRGKTVSNSNFMIAKKQVVDAQININSNPAILKWKNRRKEFTYSGIDNENGDQHRKNETDTAPLNNSFHYTQ